MSKKLIIALALVIAGIAICGAVNYKRATDLQAYAEANNCQWSATGTMYGDNRDYICR